MTSASRCGGTCGFSVTMSPLWPLRAAIVVAEPKPAAPNEDTRPDGSCGRPSRPELPPKRTDDVADGVTGVTRSDELEQAGGDRFRQLGGCATDVVSLRVVEGAKSREQPTCAAFLTSCSTFFPS